MQDGVALALWDGDTMLGALPRTPYRVRQLAGVSRGYEIEEFASDGPLEPDFYAMRVRKDAELTHVGLLAGGAAGDPVDGSIRQVRVVALRGEALLFLPALLPLVIGLALRMAQRRPVRW